MRKYSYITIIKNIILLLLFSEFGFAQQPAIKGTIKDNTGKPISGAVVSFVDLPGNQIYSDQNGNFSINAKSGSYIKVETPDGGKKTVKVAGNPLNVVMNNNANQVELGFGVAQPQEELTSAIGIVRLDDLSKSSAINPANALFGKIPGLSVMQNGGTSWQNDPDLYIRGVGTTGDASILVLVDGFERPISSLSLLEIESIAVLKDAAALALYGQRGANGILLVTTRRGKGKGLHVDFSYEHGISQAFRLPNFLDASGYANAVNEARNNDGLSPLYSQQDLTAFSSSASPYLFPNVNWMKETFRDFGSTDLVNATFQGNTKSVRYFSMINYQNDNGLLGPVTENAGYKTQFKYSKINFRSNIDVDLTKSTKLRFDAAGNLRDANQPGSSPSAIMTSLFSTPAALYPVKTNNNKWGGTSSLTNNPVALVAATGYAKTHTSELLMNLSLEQKLDFILPGLSVEGALAYDNSAGYLDNYTRQYQIEQLTPVRDAASGAILNTVSTLYGTNTELSFSSSLSTQWRNSSVWGKINYSKDWADNSIKSVLIYQQSKWVGNGQFSTYLHQSVAGNAHYSKSGKYFADLTVAYSGTNILPTETRFGLYPALSLAWKLSEETWFGMNSIIKDLKLRASWGMTGNNLVAQNIALQKFTSEGSNYFFGANSTAVSGFLEGQLGSPDVKAETSQKSNIGLDASLFGKLNMNLDVFYDRRSNIMNSTNGLVSGVLGVTSPSKPLGIVDNKGMELGINVNDKVGDFTYTIGGQFSFVRSKIVEMSEVYRPYDYLKRTGNPVGQYFGLESIGFFSDQADINNSPKQLFSAVKPGDVKYKDQNKDGIIDQYDEIAIGYNNQVPEMYYSGSVSIEYKGLGLDALFQGTANSTVYLNTRSVFWPLRGENTISGFSDNRWTPVNKASATLPRLSIEENLNNYRSNSTWLRNGSFLKLRSLEIYYKLPETLTSKMKLAQARLYLRGMNLFSIDDVKVLDPEEIRVVYPTMTSFNLGFQIGF